MPTTDPATRATFVTQAEFDALLKEAETGPFDLEVAICDLLEFHGDDAEEVARKGAAQFREAGDLTWAERYEQVAAALAEGRAAYKADPPPVSKLSPEEEAALDREMAISAASMPRLEGDEDPEAAARRCAAKWRQAGNISWAERYDRMADAIAEVKNENAKQHA